MAEQLINEFTVNRSIDEAWPIITDVERIAPCLPGAQLTEIRQTDDGEMYAGNVKVKLGAIATEFKGEAFFVERDDANYTCNAYFDRNSQPLVAFVSRKIRQWPPGLGQGSSSCEVDNDEVLSRQEFANMILPFYYMKQESNRAGVDMQLYDTPEERKKALSFQLSRLIEKEYLSLLDRSNLISREL